MMRCRRAIALLLTLLLTLGAIPVYATETEDTEEPLADLFETAEEELQEDSEPVQQEETLPAPEEGETPSEEQPEEAEEIPAVSDLSEAETEEAEEIPAVSDLSEAEETEEAPDSPELSEDWVAEMPAAAQETETPASEPGQEEPAPQPEVRRPVLAVQKRKAVSLTYDDRYSFRTLLPGYSVLLIEQEKITSYQVADGVKTEAPDKAVLRIGAKAETDVIACGVGVAVVTLVPKEQLAHARALLKELEKEPVATDTSLPTEGQGEEIPCVQVTVTVSPAKLDLFYLAGQSNIEGMCNGGYDLQDSVACTPGTVYSTYLPVAAKADSITGYSGQPTLRTKGSGWDIGVKVFLPSSLTGSMAQNGEKLTYPLTALTTEGNGKTGPDSGIGYEWNRLTGHKVWLVNAGWSASTVQRWTPGGDCYERAKAAFVNAHQVWEEEVAAGHYTAGNVLMFWLQGEEDKNMSAASYLDYFDAMWNGLKAACGIKRVGMISVRASHVESRHTGEGDVIMTGPRIVQYALANNPARTDIYMVSNVNENWISDKGVQRYFAAAYPGGKLTYPGRSGANRALPTTVAAVHPWVHYRQLAHNENGITAARGMYETFFRTPKPKSVTWRDVSGAAVTELAVKPKKSAVAVPVVYPITASKQIDLSCKASILTYTPATCTVTSKAGKYTPLTAAYHGKTLGVLNVSQCAAPDGIQAVSTAAGVKITWNAAKNGEKYRVFYKTGNGRWKKLGDTKKNYYVAKKAVGGKTYTFTVRCLNAAGSAYISGFDPKGATMTYVTVPVIQSASSGWRKVTLSWSKCAGAGYYRVFYKTAEGKWKKIGDTQETSLTVRGLEKGKYTFTVRCMNSTRKTFVSAYDKNGRTVTVR